MKYNVYSSVLYKLLIVALYYITLWGCYYGIRLMVKCLSISEGGLANLNGIILLSPFLIDMYLLFIYILLVVAGFPRFARHRCVI